MLTYLAKREQLSIECCKTKTKAIANHRQCNEPIRTQANTERGPKRGKTRASFKLQLVLAGLTFDFD